MMLTASLNVIFDIAIAFHLIESAMSTVNDRRGRGVTEKRTGKADNCELKGYFVL